MAQDQPIGYKKKGYTQYLVLSSVDLAEGVTEDDLDGEDVGIAPTNHLIVIRLEPEVAKTIPEGSLADIVDSAASRILHENFAISVLDDFDIGYKFVTNKQLENVQVDFTHGGTVSDDDFDHAGVTALEGDEIDEDPTPAPGR